MHLVYLTLGTRIHAAPRANERANSRKQRAGTCTKYKGGPGARINFHFASFDNFISPSGLPPSRLHRYRAVSRQWLAKKYFQLRNETPVFLIKTHRTTRNFFRRKISEISNVSRPPKEQYETTPNNQPSALSRGERERWRTSFIFTNHFRMYRWSSNE